MIKNAVIDGSVLRDRSQTCSSCSCVSRSSEADTDRQVITCMMSSSGSLQMGQFECFRCCLFFMTTPVAAVLLNHFVMKVCEDRGTALRAIPYAFQLILDSNNAGSISNFFLGVPRILDVRFYYRVMSEYVM